jgi:hypothetical protein
MAQPDLVSQKIMNTDPQVGFGEASVLPYRQHQLDTRGFEALERAQTRDQAREEARKKNNEDYYNATIKDLPVYKRELDGAFTNWRNEVIDKTSQRVKNNVNPSSDPEVIKEVLAYKQAVTNGNQLFDELEKIKTLPVSKYVNKASLLGSAKKTVDERIERAVKGDRSALMEGSIMPDVNDPEHFLYDSYLNDKYGNRKDITTSEDKITYGPLGERIQDNKVTATFVTTKDGKVVPGIDKSVIDDELYLPTTDADTLQARAVTFSFADKQILNKALQLKEAGDPRYKDMGTNQIVASISSNPADPHYKEFNRNKLAEDLTRTKLERFQKVSTDNNITSGHRYTTDGDGSGTKTKDFKIEPAIINQNSATGNSLTAPGVVLTKRDKPLTLTVAANQIYDFEKGAIDFKNTARVPINATGVGYALANKSSNKILAFDNPDALIKYINTAPKKDLDKLDLNQYVFGNIEEKRTVQGDTGEDDPEDKTEQNVNRSIAIKYDQANEVGAQINASSGGTFNNRELTADEKRVKEAWDNRVNNVSDSDLIQQINDKYPNATKEQKLAIFKKVKGN